MIRISVENGEAFNLDSWIFVSKQWGLFDYWITVIAENQVCNGNFEGLGH